MGYWLEAAESLPDGIRRIVGEQIDEAVTQLENSEADRDEAVHEARKCFKKIRAALRLVRDEIGRQVYKPENVFYRDLGRRLSEVRDSAVMVETLDVLAARFEDQVAPGTWQDVRAELVAAHQATRERILDQEGAAEQVADELCRGRARVAEWPIERKDFTALRGGIRRVYRRGHDRLTDAYAEPSPERFHEWRKRVKYLWYHVRILNPVWPEPLDALSDALHTLANHLGQDHDLYELRQVVVGRPEMFEDESALQFLLALLSHRRAELEGLARPLGERIYAEDPDTFVQRLAAYWRVWAMESTLDRV